MGALTAGTQGGNVVAEQTAPPAKQPAYMIVSGKRLKPPEAMTAYRQAAGGPARAAGLEMLASKQSRADVYVLEGEWPYDGFVVLEKYSSMQALLKFWDSPEYRAAKKLREGAVKMDFIIAVEGDR
jgi:uncharacterized protein (DUF1330 family)